MPVRDVAAYVMRSRLRAILVATLGASSLLFAWVSAAVVALVTLRRGAAEGGLVLLWALLPAGYALARFADPGSASLLLGSIALAAVLRWLASWPAALLAAVAVGAASGYALLLFGQAHLEALMAAFARLLEGLRANLPAGSELRAPAAVTVAGMLGLMNAVTCVLCLLLARYWQAALYNPGGFREEFHGLRLAPQLGAGLALLMLAVGSLGVAYRPWAALFAVPLSVAGLGFIHASAARRGHGAVWLGVFYPLWLLLDAVKLIVMGVAVADSFLDFRGRWRGGAPGGPPRSGEDGDSR